MELLPLRARGSCNNFAGSIGLTEVCGLQVLVDDVCDTVFANRLWSTARSTCGRTEVCCEATYSGPTRTVHPIFCLLTAYK